MTSLTQAISLNHRERDAVSVNIGFAQASNDFLIAALLIYSLAVLAFAGDYAFGRPRRKAAVKAAAPATAQLATVGAGTASGASVSETETPAAPPAPAALAPRVGVFKAIGEAGPWVQAAVAFSVLGTLAHV